MSQKYTWPCTCCSLITSFFFKIQSIIVHYKLWLVIITVSHNNYLLSEVFQKTSSNWDRLSSGSKSVAGDDCTSIMPEKHPSNRTASVRLSYLTYGRKIFSYVKVLNVNFSSLHLICRKSISHNENDAIYMYIFSTQYLFVAFHFHITHVLVHENVFIVPVTF